MTAQKRYRVIILVALIIILSLSVCLSRTMYELSLIRRASKELHDTLISDRFLINFACDEIFGKTEPSSIEELSDGNVVKHYYFTSLDGGHLEYVPYDVAVDDISVSFTCTDKISDSTGVPEFFSITDYRFGFYWSFINGILHTIREYAYGMGNEQTVGKMLVHYAQYFDQSFNTTIFLRPTDDSSLESTEYKTLHSLCAEGKFDEIQSQNLGEVYTTPGGSILIF